jgi:hypothetical protein
MRAGATSLSHASSWWGKILLFHYFHIKKICIAIYLFSICFILTRFSCRIKPKGFSIH